MKRGDRVIPVTVKEYALLEYLARNAGRVVGRAELCEHVWDENHDPFSNALEVYINRLRRKVGRRQSRAVDPHPQGRGVPARRQLEGDAARPVIRRDSPGRPPRRRGPRLIILNGGSRLRGNDG